ncbi:MULTISPECIES: hypothetical protein [Clostridium]|uniref:hypothetical protein n=1 Tax=Clostridium TaxID=1485 RepID=UPI0005FBD0DB|nr:MULTISPECIES: hypothetical protein [Clostridium]MDU0322766.1 hypothetical protein [Clostridium butyricum]
MLNLIKYFKDLGMKNPLRSIKLINDAIRVTKLDLRELVVFTEAASGEFIYTPIIAAMAGAKKVYAIAGNSDYGSKEEIKKNTLLFAELCGVNEKIEVVFDKNNIKDADIITNLGFVRPIDKRTIDNMKENAVVPYMCEAWEVREGDVDIDYCRKKGIKVMGTNEDFEDLDVFNFTKPLIIKMLLDIGIEIYKSKIIILSNDKFGKVIEESLLNVGANAILLNEITEENLECIKCTDALIIADYTSKECFIGANNSVLNGKNLKKLCPYISIIQFAGLVDIEDLEANNIEYYPKKKVGSVRMGRTLAYVGAKPIIDLHSAGLKVGELMHNYNMESEFLGEYDIMQKI